MKIGEGLAERLADRDVVHDAVTGNFCDIFCDLFIFEREHNSTDDNSCLDEGEMSDHEAVGHPQVEFAEIVEHEGDDDMGYERNQSKIHHVGGCLSEAIVIVRKRMSDVLVELVGQLGASLGIFEAIVFRKKGSADIHANACQGRKVCIHFERRCITFDYAVSDRIQTAKLVRTNNIRIEPWTLCRWRYNRTAAADRASVHTIVIH